MVYLGRVIDKEHNVFFNRERGLYTYDPEADTYGTPMVVIPLANDEIINGRMVVRNNYGVMYEDGKDIGRQELSELIDAVEKDDNIRKHLSDDQKENSECSLNRICEEVLREK